MTRAIQGRGNRSSDRGRGGSSLHRVSGWLCAARKEANHSGKRRLQLRFEQLEGRQLLGGSGIESWPMKYGDIGNTGRATFAVPTDRMNDSFFDVFAWQTPTPGSPNEGNVDSTSMVFYDGVGPQGADLVVGGYHWQKGVQGMDRHTGQVFWFGNPGGGESIGRNAPAFSNDGSVVYVTNDATQSTEWPQGHPLMAFYSNVGPSTFWHNGEDPQVNDFGAFSPKVAPDGRIFSHTWVGHPVAATDTPGVKLEQTWAGASVADEGLSDPALYVDHGSLRVVTAGRGGQIKQYDGTNGSGGAERWSVDTFQFTDATPTIDPDNGNIYVPVGDESSISIAGLTKDGTALWTSTTLPVYTFDGTNHRQWADAGGALSYDGSTYYFQADSLEGDGRLYAINTANGSVKWSFETHAAREPGDSALSSPIITQNGVVIIGNNCGGVYYAIRDDGTQGTQLDTLSVELFEGASLPAACATATLSSDGLLYLPLRTVQTAAPPGEVPSYQVQNLFTALDLNAGATAKLYPPAHQRAFAGNDSVTIQWEPIPDPTGQFDHYAIYRSTAAFSSVSGMTPIETMSGVASSEYRDGTASNGVHYFYAVTTVSKGGGEITQINSIGPRTPYDETDLQVVSIARDPEFPRYAAQYASDVVTEPTTGFGPYLFTASTGLGAGQQFSDPRFPSDGQNVTYTATVRNRGTNPFTGLLSVSWFLDGGKVLDESQTFDVGMPLLPGVTTTFAYALSWDNASHDLTFTINTVDARPENNTLTSDPLAVPFLTYVDKSFIEQFREEWTPSGKNDDLIDWLNSHMTKFNELFAAAGVDKRVHYGVLQVLDDVALAPTVENDPNSPYAVFPFRYRAGVDGNPRLSGYYDLVDDIDYGLLHEMGHQLGLIDIYQFDLPAVRNEVSHLGYYGAPTDLMHGVSHVLSPFSALAMEHWLHQAHGYYGQFMYNLPQIIKLRILDYQGNPLPGASVEMYQMVDRPNLGPVITNQIKAAGTTDSAGVFELPNVPIDPTLVPPIATGDTLHANPFGYVAVVGTNGVLHFKVQYNGITDYAWLDITEPNVAYFQGQTEAAVFDRQLALGMPLQTEPPADLAEISAGAWTPWAEGATATATYDTDRKIVGDASLSFSTQGGFDNYVRYPRDFDARWNLTGQDYLNISFYAENANNPKFQSGSPWIRLIDVAGNYYEYQYYVNGAPSDLLNQAIDQWSSFSIPLNASPDVVNGWHRIQFGTPDLTQIHFLEVHADTWGYGFTLWLDDVYFSSGFVTRIWDGGSLVNNLWSTAANWAGDVAPLPGDNLVFPAGAAQLDSVNDYPSGVAFGSIIVSGTGYHFQTGESSSTSLQVQSGNQLEADRIITGTLTIGAGAKLTISPSSSGSGSMAGASPSAASTANSLPQTAAENSDSVSPSDPALLPPDAPDAAAKANSASSIPSVLVGTSEPTAKSSISEKPLVDLKPQPAAGAVAEAQTIPPASSISSLALQSAAGASLFENPAAKAPPAVWQQKTWAGREESKSVRPMSNSGATPFANPPSFPTGGHPQKSSGPSVFFPISAKSNDKSSWETAPATQDNQSQRLQLMNWDWLQDLLQTRTKKHDLEQNRTKMEAVDTLFGNLTFH